MNSDFLAWNARGIFLGPTEKEEAFFQRAAAAHPCSTDPFTLTQTLFDATPDWIPIEKTAKGLCLWEGAATWIEEGHSLIRIKPTLKGYLQEEVAAHELVHAMRLCFHERQFEEILAYRTAKNRIRRFLGPLFSKPSEAKGFLLLITLSFLITWTEIFTEKNLYATVFLSLPFAALLWGMCRLIRSQTIFSSCLAKLKSTLRDPSHALPVALRLSDAEIRSFAKQSPASIRAFATSEAKKHLRWKILLAAYF